MLAAQVGLHPGRLGQMLKGTLPLDPDVAVCVRHALEYGARHGA